MKARKALLYKLLVRLAPELSLRWARDNAVRGMAGEIIAARHLRQLGHRLLARNLRHPRAELDIVTRADRHLVVVEVKTGVQSKRPHEDRFTPSGRLRRRLAAAEIARRLGLSPRLDLIEVHLTKARRVSLIRHKRDI